MSYLDGKITKEDLRAPYTEKQWIEFQGKLANTLANTALCGEDIANDTTAKDMVAKFINDELLKADLSILGDTLKFAHMDIIADGQTKTYPIIHRYHGHHVKMVYYFYKDKETSEYKVGTLEVNPSKIIIS